MLETYTESVLVFLKALIEQGRPTLVWVYMVWSGNVTRVVTGMKKGQTSRKGRVRWVVLNLLEWYQLDRSQETQYIYYGQ